MSLKRSSENVSNNGGGTGRRSDIEALNLFLKFMHKTIKRWHLENVFRGTI